MNIKRLALMNPVLKEVAPVVDILNSVTLAQFKDFYRAYKINIKYIDIEDKKLFTKFRKELVESLIPYSPKEDKSRLFRYLININKINECKLYIENFKSYRTELGFISSANNNELILLNDLKRGYIQYDDLDNSLIKLMHPSISIEEISGDIYKRLLDSSRKLQYILNYVNIEILLKSKI